jgi:hypothetical protein
VVRHKSVRDVSSVCNAFISVMQFAELRNLDDVPWLNTRRGVRHSFDGAKCILDRW